MKKDVWGNNTRGRVIFGRTYARPKDEEEGAFETYEDVAQRVYNHQKWLWERQQAKSLSKEQEDELREWIELILEQKVCSSGRTLWMADQEIATRREIAHFNCCFTEAKTVLDIVDIFWLLLQGCGVGFEPIIGQLNGFKREIPEIEFLEPTEEFDKGPIQQNHSCFEDGVWTIVVGDAAECWAKAVGKVLAEKHNAKRLVIDLSNIRRSGVRLKGYGWISAGHKGFLTALKGIVEIMNRRSGQLLRKIDILDICNHLGATLSSRRAAEIMLFPYKEKEWKELAAAKKDLSETNNPQRFQSNNTMVFKEKPTRKALQGCLAEIIDNGGSEPGFLNLSEALRRAPFVKGTNPCGEILLTDGSVCNLTEVNVSKFTEDYQKLLRAIYLTARANYRQTLVNFKDEILQEKWHKNNQFLRLCGVGLTGIVMAPDLTEYELKEMRNQAVFGAYSMATELGTETPKNITTVKPSGTLSKMFGCTEGIHMPLGKYIINNVNFGVNDPLLPKLKSAGYHTRPNPNDEFSVLVKFPIKYDNVEFTRVTTKDGRELDICIESAVEQLERYKKFMKYWADHNVSITVSYDPSEAEEIVDWIYDNWDNYVGISFLFRNDPTKTAEDLGYAYLPQDVVTKEVSEEAVSGLSAIDFSGTDTEMEIDIGEECSTGACPIK